METKTLYTIINKVTKQKGNILAVSKYEAVEKARSYDQYKFTFENYKVVKFKG
jgi:hypothetical protein